MYVTLVDAVINGLYKRLCIPCTFYLALSYCKYNVNHQNNFIFQNICFLFNTYIVLYDSNITIDKIPFMAFHSMLKICASWAANE